MSNPGRCLITGMSGFTGVYLERELRDAGYQVFGLASALSITAAGAVAGGSGFSAEAAAAASARTLPAHIITADLTDLDAVRRAVLQVRPDVVIHLAAIAFVAHGDVETMYRTNVVGTRNLLQALAEGDHTPRVVLLASSANIYGNTESDAIVEDTPPMPENDYAVSKLAMEYMARLWQGDLPITVARPFNYTGVGQSVNFLIPKIVDHFRSGAREIELGNLDVARDFSDVRAVVAAYRGLVDRPVPGQVFNICSGRAHSPGDVINMLEQIAGYEISVKVNPAFVRANEVKHLRGSNARLLAAVGELPAISLADTLEWMYRA